MIVKSIVMMAVVIIGMGSRSQMVGGTDVGACPSLEVEVLGTAVPKISIDAFLDAGMTSSGREYVWGLYRTTAVSSMVGFSLNDGKTLQINFKPLGHYIRNLLTLPDGSVLVTVKNPWGLYRYVPASKKLEKLLVNSEHQKNWTGNYYGLAKDGDGNLYFGCSIGGRKMVLGCWNAHKDEFTSYGKLTGDPNQSYVLKQEFDKDGNLYNLLGLHHPEIVAFKPMDKSMQQILPSSKQHKGEKIKLWKGIDGNVYTQIRNENYICSPNKIKPVTEISPEVKGLQLSDGTRVACHMNSSAVLTVKNLKTGEKKSIQTDFEPSGADIHCLSYADNSRIWGGSKNPGKIFYYDRKTSDIVNYPQRLGHQIYSIHPADKSLLISSYVGGVVYSFKDKPETLLKKVVKLSSEYQQERIYDFVRGYDGMVYSPTRPVKGILGGGILQINPETLNWKFYRNVIVNQTISSLLSLDNTAGLLGTSSIWGGTTAIAKAEKPYIFIWNTQTKKTEWKFSPLKDVDSYYSLVKGKGSIVYAIGAAEKDYHDTKTGPLKLIAFNPFSQKVINITGLDVKKLRSHGLINSNDSGKTIFGMAELENGTGVLLKVDSDSHRPVFIGKNPTFAEGKGLFATEDGFIYYGHAGNLMRVKQP